MKTNKTQNLIWELLVAFGIMYALASAIGMEHGYLKNISTVVLGFVLWVILKTNVKNEN